MEGFSEFGKALVELASLSTVGHVAWATLLGIFVGSLPGLTATMGVALLTTLTYTLDRDTAILVLICMYVGAIYGGCRLTAIRSPGRAGPATPWRSPPRARRWVPSSGLCCWCCWRHLWPKLHSGSARSNSSGWRCSVSSFPGS